MDYSDCSKLFQNISTKKEAISFVEKMFTISNALYQIDTNLESKLSEFLTSEEKKLLIEYANEKNIKLSDPQQFQKLSANIKDEVNRIPTITLSLAEAPTEYILKNISNWILSKLNRKVFVEMEIDPSLIAGAIITSNGTLKDYSIKKLINEKYKNVRWISQ